MSEDTKKFLGMCCCIAMVLVSIFICASQVGIERARTQVRLAELALEAIKQQDQHNDPH